jgi:hypothetical protein
MGQGLPWIPVHTNLPNHPKSIALGAAIGDRRAWTYVLQAWLWAAEHAPDGRLSGRNGAVLIEHAAGWTGEPGAFAAAAVDAGFVDKGPDGSFVFHDWDLMNGAHVAKRARDAARQRERRLRLVSTNGEDVADASDGRPRDVRVTALGRERDESREEEDHVGQENPEPAGRRAEDLRALWNAEKAPEMPEWRKSSDKRAKAARARLKERPDMGEWREVVQRLAKSDFARGLVPGRDGRKWLAGPEFLLRPDSADKVLEGTYDNRGGQVRASAPEEQCRVL